MPLKNHIRDIQGFPKEGILFKDITPLLIDPEARNKCLEILLSSLKNKKIDKVIGVESRGFFFGMQGLFLFVNLKSYLLKQLVLHTN